MKRALLLNFCLALLLAVTGSVGCRKKPIGPTPIPSSRGGPGSGGPVYGAVDAPPISNGSEVASSTTGLGGLNPQDIDVEFNMLRDEEKFRDYIVYFDFDRSTIRSADQSKIEVVADHLKSNPMHKVKVEGHADERGTEGYNLALGERRALSVRDYLINLGISPDRVGTTSFGELQPAELGQNEAAWAANRRAEFVLLLPLP
jgi:peptidoglycan-associated lipoprotein